MILPALSILDQSSIVSGRTPADAILESLALVRLAHRPGCARCWLAGHHSSQSHAGSAPELLISAIAATTRRIRAEGGRAVPRAGGHRARAH